MQDFSHGEGVYLYTPSGQRLLDFGTGIGVNALGNSFAHTVQQKNHHNLTHISPLFGHEVPKKLEEIYATETFPDSNKTLVTLVPSGTLATENALQMSLKYGEDRNCIVAFEHGFHGRSSLSALATHKFHHLHNKRITTQVTFLNPEKEYSVEELRTIFTHATVGIFEPIIGEGGVIPISKKTLEKMIQVAREVSCLTILDEIQTGGRTGKNLLITHGLTHRPDIVTIGKALGGGAPVAATIFGEKLASQIQPHDLGGTYNGNIASCYVALEATRQLNSHEIRKNIENIEILFSEKLAALQKKFPKIILSIRGAGCMWGIGLQSSYPANQIQSLCHSAGLVVMIARNNTVIRLLPPVILENFHVNDGFDILESVFSQLQ